MKKISLSDVVEKSEGLIEALAILRRGDMTFDVDVFSKAIKSLDSLNDYLNLYMFKEVKNREPEYIKRIDVAVTYEDNK